MTHNKRINNLIKQVKNMNKQFIKGIQIANNEGKEVLSTSDSGEVCTMVQDFEGKICSIY